MSKGTVMDIKQGFYNITIKREPIEQTDPIADTEEYCDIEINNHEIKQEVVDDYEEYDEFSEIINNVKVKEEVMLPDEDSELNNYNAPTIETEPENPPVLPYTNGEIKSVNPQNPTSTQQKNYKEMGFIRLKRQFTLKNNQVMNSVKQQHQILPQKTNGEVKFVKLQNQSLTMQNKILPAQNKILPVQNQSLLLKNQSLLQQNNQAEITLIKPKNQTLTQQNHAEIKVIKPMNQQNHAEIRPIKPKTPTLDEKNYVEIKLVKGNPTQKNHEVIKSMKILNPNSVLNQAMKNPDGIKSLKILNPNSSQQNLVEIKLINPTKKPTYTEKVKLLKLQNSILPEELKLIQIEQAINPILAPDNQPEMKLFQLQNQALPPLTPINPTRFQLQNSTIPPLTPINPTGMKLLKLQNNEVEVQLVQKLEENHDQTSMKSEDELQYSIQRESQLGLPHDCYDCNDCKTRNQSSARLKRYKLAARFSCDVCNTRFITQDRYLMHLKTHEPKSPAKDVMRVYPTVKMYGCVKCPKMCATMEALTMHAYIHNRCKVCNKRFESTQELEKHQTVHLTKFQCKECEMTFDAKSYLDNHRESWHQNYRDCKYCKRKISKPQFQAHFVQCIMRTQIDCKICRRKFKTTLDLNNHVCPDKVEKGFDFDNLVNFSTSSSGIKVYECGLCRKQFHMLQSLKNHLKEHENMNEPQYEFKCGNCEVKFNSQKDLDDHSCKNESDDEFSLDDLKKYLVPHNGVKVYGCVVCKKRFYTAQSFKTHLSTHSQNKQQLLKMKKEVDSTNEPFECVQCKTKFPSEEALKLHIRFHYDKPPYKCNKCGKKNFTLASLRSHLIKCSDAKFYDCSECKEMFVEEKHLKSHILSSHKVASETTKLEVEVTVESPLNSLHFPSCPRCNIYFMGKTQLEEHLKSDHKVIDPKQWYKCESCKKIFKTSLGFEKHKILHTDIKAFACEECPDKFHTRQGLTFHMLIHSKAATISCWQCHMKFPSEYKLMMHSKSTHPNNKCFKCEKCGRLFVSIQGFENHKTKCLGQTDFDCPHCGKTLSNQHCYNQHVGKHNRRLECPECDRKFASKLRLENHLSVHSGEKPYRCSVCGKTFTIEKNLGYHMRAHTGDLPYECDHCKKKFMFKVTLITHMSVHNAEIASACQYCGKRVEGHEMKEHIKTQHARKKLLKCYKCERRFPKKSILNDHIKTHFAGTFRCKKCDGEFESGTDYVNHICYFYCDICRKRFKSNACLKNHYVKVHPRIKPFECSICNKRFAYKFTLNSHLNSHALRKNFKCYVCKKQFRFKSSLVAHWMGHGLATLYKCDVCKRKFFTKSELSEHISDDHLRRKSGKKSGSGLKCKCGIKFQSKDLYKKHLAVHSNEKSFECNECKKKFAFKIGLETHMLTHFGGVKNVKGLLKVGKS